MNDRLQFIANSIAKAKKVMDKVESGSYSKGHIDADFVAGKTKAPASNGRALPMAEQYVPQPQHQPAAQPRQSKLPSAILESFQKNPGMSGLMGAVDTSNPLAMNMLQMDQLAGAVKQQTGGRGGLTPEQRAMLEENYGPTHEAPGFSQQYTQAAAPSFSQQYTTHQYPAASAPVAPQAQMITVSEDYLKFLLEQAVEKAVEKLLAEQAKNKQTIDENIEITIGGKKFGGKIKTLKS
jgi:hypothetical protein